MNLNVGTTVFCHERQSYNSTSTPPHPPLVSRRLSSHACQTVLPPQGELAQLEIMIGGDTGLRGGIDIFAGPPKPIGGRVGGMPSASAVGVEEGEPTKIAGSSEVDGGTYTMFDEDGDPGTYVGGDGWRRVSPCVFVRILFVVVSRV